MAFLLLIFTFWLIWTIGLSQMGPVTEAEEQSSVKKHIDLPDLYNISFATRRPSLEWVKHDLRDGVFSYRSPTTNDIILQSIEGGVAGILVNATDLSINEGQLEVEGFEISQDAQYILFKTNVTKLWRYSSYANMYVYHVSNKTLFPLHPLATVNNTPMVSYAVWSPQGHQLAYVLGNDLFVTDLQNTTRITFDGSSTIFNGVPDWVYEEEVFSKNYAVWWSPDATHLAYLRFNETAVPEYHMQYYTASNNSYPDETSIRYPKAGSPNPLVSLHVHSLPTNTTFMITHSDVLNTTQGFPETDRLITDVVWATETHTHLLFKQTNRIQDTELTHLVSLSPNLTQSSIQLARTYKPNDGGWVDLAQTMVFIPNKKANDSVVRYLDVIDDGKGFMHLAILRATDTKPRSPHWLTSGKWEVVSGSVVVDKTRQLVHYISTEKSHLERHLYSIQLNHSKPIRTKLCLTCADDEEVHAYYDASFSPQYGYYVLQYEGPDIPTTVVKKIDNSSFELVLQDNQPLRDVLSEYELPRTRMVSVKSGGIDMDAMEVLPPDFDATKKYPVLFHVYGGPGSQLASYQFELSWSTFLASKLGYIIVTVDGRGTGFKGRKYRSGVRERLGELETIDQINAARHWASLEYVDPSRIAIWGWSYGGYMASKVIEANSGLYAAGMAVAPVTDWRFYDSVYTERYMSTPELNPEGYIQSAVNNMTGFENTRYLLVHGTGDDNVHFQNAAVLVDKLTQANVHNYQVQFYTDNSHPIQYHNANQNVYYLLTNFLWER
ncbi:dipeptidyl peptidase IV N-terminal region-domain-containing protein [Gilbertella persicaria]|uniref:dipeptidyl peptidase IV N-terminal region-domain-containing protein n=1 Tax=Gilbertella persicaria TaxID=101096 RepID=UPI0022209697|nr:dipeptidyl peptidase IV N-terminal region-domain-containing protein [Gilbertella persicaria]KAI8091317.1 dipeptidyl peptidase IV N-terminal region-domain-containing protein [Gilbertella persicaria]